MTGSGPAALLVIDVQQGLDDPRWGERNNPDAERRMAALLAAWRAAKWPVIHVQHMSQHPESPLRAGLPGNALKPEVLPRDGEPLFQKRVNSAFIGTELDSSLKGRGATTLVVVGFTTDHCVSSTVRMAGNLGYRTIVVADGTATFERRSADDKPVGPEIIHQIHLLSLQGEFAEVLDTDLVLALSEEE